MKTWNQFLESRDDQIQQIARIKNHLGYIMGVSEEELAQMKTSDVAKLIGNLPDYSNSDPMKLAQIAAMVKQFSTV